MYVIYGICDILVCDCFDVVVEVCVGNVGGNCGLEMVVIIVEFIKIRWLVDKKRKLVLISKDDLYYVCELGVVGVVIIVFEWIDGIFLFIGKVDFGYMC